MKKLLFQSSVLMLLIALSGCGGSKVLKEPEPLVVTQSLATASDQRLAATLDWVIVRDGPGTWAKNVDWDEYLIRVQNLSDEPIRVTNVAVLDSLGTRIEIGGNRRQLIDGTKETTHRYTDEGLKVEAGVGGGTIAVAGVAVFAATTVVGTSAVIAALGGSSAAVGAVGATAAVLPAVVIVAPALIVGGIVRSMNNSAVNKQIESQQTLLPAVLLAGQGQNLDLFFPLAPSPRQLQFTYVDSQGEHTLSVDIRAALNGLHLTRP